MGPVDLIISGSSYADWIRGEKGGAEIEASMPRPIRTPRSAPLRARPQISHPAESASNKSVCQTRCFRRCVARRSSKLERSLDAKIEWIESTEDKLLPVNEEILDPEQRTTRAQRLIGNDINSFFTRSLNPFGANDGVMYLG